MPRKENHYLRSILILAISLVITFVVYNFVSTNYMESSRSIDSSSSNATITDVSYADDEQEEVVDQSAQIVGSWKYYIFPEQCDATKYLTFRSDGTFEMYENPGAAYATHCQAKESGTYTFDGENLTLNYMNANWPYTLNWIDENSFNLTYVTQVNTCTRVSDDEYNDYLN